MGSDPDPLPEGFVRAYAGWIAGLAGIALVLAIGFALWARFHGI